MNLRYLHGMRRWTFTRDDGERRWATNGMGNVIHVVRTVKVLSVPAAVPQINNTDRG
jgi:hypothetical protein